MPQHFTIYNFSVCTAENNNWRSCCSGWHFSSSCFLCITLYTMQNLQHSHGLNAWLTRSFCKLDLYKYTVARLAFKLQKCIAFQHNKGCCNLKKISIKQMAWNANEFYALTLELFIANIDKTQFASVYLCLLVQMVNFYCRNHQEQDSFSHDYNICLILIWCGVQ